MNDSIIVNDVDLFVTGEIGVDFTADYFMQSLNSIPSDETINVHIFSGGGSVFEALAVYDFVKLKGIKFNAYISGLSGSAATIIGAAANNTYIGANSFYMIHRAYNPSGEDSAETQRVIDSINERIIKIYQDLTGLSKPRVKQLMDAGDRGEFIKSKDAISLGFVNSEFKEAQLAANIEWYNEVVNKSSINNMNKPELNLEELELNIVNKTIEGVKNYFSKKEKEVSVEAIENSVKEEVSNHVKEITNKVEEITNEFEAEKVKFEAEKLELQNSIEAKDKEINELKGTETKVEVVASVENPTDEKAEKTEGEKILANIMSNVTSVDKLKASIK